MRHSAVTLRGVCARAQRLPAITTAGAVVYAGALGAPERVKPQ